MGITARQLSQERINICLVTSYKHHLSLHRLSTHRDRIQLPYSTATITTNNNDNINNMTVNEKTIASLAKSLLDNVVDAYDPSPESALDVVAALQKECNNKTMTIAILESTKIGKMLTKTVKACKRQRRTSDAKAEWDTAISAADELIATLKEAADKEVKSNANKKKAADDTAFQKVGLPNSVAIYRTRLASQKKEMYKDPPSMPPGHIIIEPNLVSEPKRNKTTGELTFVPGEDDVVRSLLENFHPNRTPEEVLRVGSFGGTYFRPITSSVTNVKYSSSAVLRDTVQPEWIAGLDRSLLTSSTYNARLNKYAVKCGGSLGMWESSGWISDSDPYGWFQWYCRFYSGRRCSDDARQVGRWCKSAGLKGRFRSQICNKIIAAGTTAGDKKISPVIRQTLLHWGLEVTEDVLEKHRRR